MYILEVVPISKSIRSESLRYFCAKEVALGALVTIPLRKQEIRGVVIAKDSVTNLKSIVRSSSFSIRNVVEVHDTQLFSPAFLTMAYHLSQYTTEPTGVVLETLLPKAVTKDLSSYARTISIPPKETQSDVLLLQRNVYERHVYYKTRTRELFAQNASLVIVCPTVEKCITLSEIFSNAISRHAFCFHSSLTTKKVREQFKKLQEEPSPVVLIITPNYLSFAPDNTAEYIIESASSSSYRTISGSSIDLRIGIEMLAGFSGVPCVYADTILGVDLWYRQMNKDVQVIEPQQKKVIDIKNLEVLSFQPKEEKQTEAERLKELMHTHSGFHPLHHASLDVIRDCLKKKKNIVVYVPKKGKAPNMVCNDCGKIAVSQSGHPLSLFVRTDQQTKQKEHIYIAQATGERVPAFDECQYCKGVNLKKMGIATTSVAEAIQKEFKKEIPISIVDAHNCKTKKAIAQVRKHHSNKKGHIFVGTSKLLSVLPSWDEVIIVSLAPLLSRMSYRNEEDILLLITQLQERCVGTTYLQDRKDLLSHLEILEHGMHQPFIEQQLRERKSVHFPPYQRIIKLQTIVQKRDMKQHYSLLLKRYRDFDPSIIVMPHSKNEVALHMVIKVAPHEWSYTYQNLKLHDLLQGHERGTTIHIDPLRLS